MKESGLEDDNHARVLYEAVSQLFVTLLSHIYIGCFKASMHVLYPERLLFSLTKDIRIKLIFYYQTLYTTEVANNTEFKERSFFFFNVFTFLSSATQESTVQNNSLS